MNALDENRVRVVSISAREVLDLFRVGAGEFQPTYTHYPRFLDLPEGYQVVSLREDWQSRTICFLIAHESFDRVPVGEYVPRHPSGPIERFAVRVVWPGSAEAELLATLEPTIRKAVSNDPQVGNEYICEKCSHRFEHPSGGLQCPQCHTDRVRKWRVSDTLPKSPRQPAGD